MALRELLFGQTLAETYTPKSSNNKPAPSKTFCHCDRFKDGCDDTTSRVCRAEIRVSGTEISSCCDSALAIRSIGCGSTSFGRSAVRVTMDSVAGVCASLC